MVSKSVSDSPSPRPLTRCGGFFVCKVHHPAEATRRAPLVSLAASKGHWATRRTAVQARPKRCAEQLPFSRVRIGKRCVHGLDRNRRYDAREKQPEDTNPDRECPRESLPRYEIAITNREAGDEGEIDRVADGPALKKANDHAKGNLNRKYYR